MHVCTRYDERPIDLLTAPRPAQERSSSKRPSIQVRRRRTLLGIAVIAMLVMLALPWGGTGGPSLATPGAAHAGPLVAGTTYVVRQGDTLWGIAVRLAGGSDPRPLVARLETEAGGDDVHPGQQLVLP
jgi:nucleoid-associated protein YgaU